VKELTDAEELIQENLEVIKLKWMRYSAVDMAANATNVWVENNKICILPNDDSEVRFPIAANKKLRNTKERELKHIERIAHGTGLHWPDLDEDLSHAGIMEGRYGRKD